MFERKNHMHSLGKKFRLALTEEKPLQIVGTINAINALLAQKANFRAIYLSGAGVANASFGLPDLGITTLNDVLEDARRITSTVDLPLLVDIDTGFGSAFNIARTIREMIKAGVAASHIEDQIAAKRCGHRPKKSLVQPSEMVDRIKAALDAKTDPDFIIMARTDALTIEGLNPTLDRVHQYIEAGADMIFFEGVRTLEELSALRKICKLPILVNMTEFGVTPLFTKEELKNANVDMILYPLSAFRVMNKAAFELYETIRGDGTQKSLLSKMQTREELYELLNYYSYEAKLDELFAKGKIHE
jgi:methylisocitrate lyase